jgi:tetratricopeptide (TPR) repeat protein
MCSRVKSIIHRWAIAISIVSIATSTLQARVAPPLPQDAAATKQEAKDSAAGKRPITPEQRARAYAKLLEGQRYYVGARTGRLTIETLRQAQRAFEEALQLDPTLAEAHTALGELAFFFLDDVETAEREAQAALKIDKDSYGAARLLARVLVLKSGLRENKIDRPTAERAIDALREVVRLNPSDAEGWALLGEIYLALGRQTEAIDAFTHWAAAPPSLDTRFYQIVTGGRELSPDAAAARLGEVLLRAGRTSEAIAAIRRAIALEPSNRDYLALLSRALEAGGGGDAVLIAELQRIVESDPTNIAALDLLARSLAEAMRYDEAIRAYEKILQARGVGQNPVTNEQDKQLVSWILERIASLQRQAGQTNGVMATIERMRRLLGRNDPTADFHYALLLRDQGKRAEAIQVLRTARLRNPDQPALIRLEATILGEMGRADEGAALLRARLKGKPEDDFIELLNIANVYLQAGRAKEAIEASRKALDLAPAAQAARNAARQNGRGEQDDERADLQTQALLMLSSAQEKAGDFKGSEESLRRILAKDPNNATALNNLGYFLVERGERLEEALEMIKRAVQAEPTNASFLDSLGWAYFKLGRLTEAEKYLSEAARRNPASATIQEHLGDVYHKLGKTDLARAAWRKALTLSIEAAETARIRAKLDGSGGKN